MVKFADMEDTLKMMRNRLVPLYGAGEARAIIEIIFKYLMGWSRVDILIRDDKDLSPTLKNRIEEILQRLEQYEPIQYITGIAPFYGVDFHVNSNVLIPRHETEQLVDMIVDKYKHISDLQVLDIATGSGCIAISLARHLPFANVTALDVSKKALDVASENAKQLKANVKWLQQDVFMFMPEAESLDIVVSNPPYVLECEKKDMDANVLNYEPALALFVSDTEPLIFYSRIAEIAMVGLKPGGMLFFEINPLKAVEMEMLLKDEGFVNVNIVNDIHNKKRFAVAEKSVE